MDNYDNTLKPELETNKESQEELIIKKLDLLVEGSKNQIKHLYYVNKTLSSINDKLTLITFILCLPFILGIVAILISFFTGVGILSGLF